MARRSAATWARTLGVLVTKTGNANRGTVLDPARVEVLPINVDQFLRVTTRIQLVMEEAAKEPKDQVKTVARTKIVKKVRVASFFGYQWCF